MFIFILYNYNHQISVYRGQLNKSKRVHLLNCQRPEETFYQADFRRRQSFGLGVSDAPHKIEGCNDAQHLH